MSAPVNVKCPHCRAGLKLKDSSRLGDKLRCPKCESPFVAEAKRKNTQKRAVPTKHHDCRHASTSRTRSMAYEPPPDPEKVRAAQEKVYKWLTKQYSKKARFYNNSGVFKWFAKSVLASGVVWLFCWGIITTDYAKEVDNLQLRRHQEILIPFQYLPKFSQVWSYTFEHNRVWPIVACLLQTIILGIYFWLKYNLKLALREEIESKDIFSEENFDKYFPNRK